LKTYGNKTIEFRPPPTQQRIFQGYPIFIPNIPISSLGHCESLWDIPGIFSNSLVYLNVNNVYGKLGIALKISYKKFGCLDSFSAFPFENYMQKIKKLIRKYDKPLQQLHRRIEEMQLPCHTFSVRTSVGKLDEKSRHFDGPLCGQSGAQYKILNIISGEVKVDSKSDGFLYTDDGIVVFVRNVVLTLENKIIVVAQAMEKKRDLFMRPCKSSVFNIFLVHEEPAQELSLWGIEHTLGKCVLLPAGDHEFCAFPLLHTSDSQ
jgi:hypothetical protein